MLHSLRYLSKLRAKIKKANIGATTPAVAAAAASDSYALGENITHEWETVSRRVAGKTENDNVMQRELSSSHLDSDDVDNGFDLKSINQSINQSIKSYLCITPLKRRYQKHLL